MGGHLHDDRPKDVDEDRRATAAAGTPDVPFQVSIAVQELLATILGDDELSLEELSPLLARLADATAPGHPEPWTAERVLARVRELDELYNPEPACRVCGCTEFEACLFGCSWVPDPEGLGALCSTCLPIVLETVPA